MKKTSKRLLSVLMTVIMVLSIVPMAEIASFAAISRNFVYEILSATDKTCKITDYTGSATNLTIPSTINGYKVTNIDNYAFSECTSLTSVTIPNSVTSIGEYAFSYCSSLVIVSMPDSLTEIRCGAFKSCYSLTSVTIPDSLTSIDEFVFANCKSLTGITIPNSVMSIGNYAFVGCSSLASVIIPNSVTNIGYSAFSECNSLKNINVQINNMNYSSLDGVLFNKDKTVLILYPAGNTRSTYIIPNSVTEISDYAFEKCTSLTNITIPDSVTSIGDYAFWYSTSLTGVDIPDSVVSIGMGAFSCCESITSITIPDSVTNIGDEAFGYYYDEYNWEYKKIDNFTIFGYKGSAAQSYAMANGFKFVAFDGELSMYRLYNKNSGEHFYTSDINEKNWLASLGWTYEGNGWNAPETSSTPVYRLYNKEGGEHHYTTDIKERNWLISLGWNDEGIGWYGIA